MSAPRRVAIVGCGELGSGWAGLFAAHGARVALVDPDPDALHRARAALDEARLFAPVQPAGSIAATSLDDAVREAEWVQESLPEAIETKREVLARLDGILPAGAIVASSTSTFGADALAAGRPWADRLLIVHPLHPVYAVPLVELGPGAATDAGIVERAATALRAVGRDPVLVRMAPPGLVANRLTAALLREALDLVARGVVTPAELDRIVRRGVATGWITLGPLATEAMGAGGGLERLPEATRSLEALWPSLATWTTLDPAYLARAIDVDRVGDGAAAQPSSRHEWAARIVRVLQAAEPGEAPPG